MDDLGEYLKAMKPYGFWKLVREHRPLLSRREAAAFLGVSVRCLEDRSARGKSPLAGYQGNLVRYHINVLEAFMTNPD